MGRSIFYMSEGNHTKLPGKTSKEYFSCIIRSYNTRERCNLSCKCHTCPQPQFPHGSNEEEEI